MMPTGQPAEIAGTMVTGLGSTQMSLVPSSMLKFAVAPFVAFALASLGAIARTYLESELAPAGPALGGGIGKKAVAFDASALYPVTIATAASVSLFYVFIFMQAGLGLHAHSLLATSVKWVDFKYTGASAYQRTFDRSVGNYLEQWIPLLVALWTYALFVDANHAALLGICWVLSRCIYPVFYWLAFVRFDCVPIIFVSTMPGYFIIWYMLGMSVLATTKCVRT
ncbi:hypothetical protein T492DRAFT_1076082 [Pavlovales sp. CCMP2436]|nr:hypothetical protein T492DRAFT_1076082 [Pavlovales sp. CCMP2436]